MTVVQLKTLCRERGLRVSGNKDEVIIRLMENDEASNPFQTRAAPAPQPMPMPMYQTQPMGGYVQPQPQYIRVQSQKEEMSKTIGGLSFSTPSSDCFGPWYSRLVLEAPRNLGSFQFQHSLLGLVSSLVEQYFTPDTATEFT